MAKSSRSKSQRANRAVKRERYALKEKAKLEKIVELAKETAAKQPTKSIYSTIGPSKTDENKMAVDGEQQDVIPLPRDEELDEHPIGTAPKTENGNYPVWMNRRAIKRAKTFAKKRKLQKKKAQKANSKPWKR